MENKIVFVYDLLSGVRVGRENESRWHCPRYGPMCYKTCEHSFTGTLGVLELRAGESKQPLRCVSPGCRSKDFPSWGRRQ